MKPFSEACLRNQEPIAEALSELFPNSAAVLEIGSGTGQHAVFFAKKLPHLRWQPTDLAESLPGIQAWLDEAHLDNIATPLILDVTRQPWPLDSHYDAAFTANTVHFVSWSIVEAMVEGVAKVVRPKGLFCIYGPFNKNGFYSSESNAQFDIWLKDRDPESGIKDIADFCIFAEKVGLIHVKEIEMPANNLIQVFRKQ